MPSSVVVIVVVVLVIVAVAIVLVLRGQPRSDGVESFRRQIDALGPEARRGVVDQVNQAGDTDAADSDETSRGWRVVRRDDPVADRNGDPVDDPGGDQGDDAAPGGEGGPTGGS